MIARVESLATGKLADRPQTILQIVDRPQSSIIPNPPLAPRTSTSIP
ncbi:hypothetical protein QUB56_33115 [Microcoleus sp. AR_TQ3_B6]